MYINVRGFFTHVGLGLSLDALTSVPAVEVVGLFFQFISRTHEGGFLKIYAHWMGSVVIHESRQMLTLAFSSVPENILEAGD